MKFFKVIAKNFKVLFRLKTTLLAIVFGPLLVIFLIGFAFNSSSAIQLTVGYHAPDNSTLTTEFISSLNDKYTTKTFEIQRDCIAELEHGLVHTCVFFPKDFAISQGKENNVTFVVDKSRVNLAYTVIEGVSEQIGIKTEELSKGLTETLTNTLTKTGTVVDSTIGSLIKIKKDMNDNINDASKISSDLEEIKLDVKDFSFTGTSDIASIDSSLDDIQDDVENFANEYYTAMGDNISSTAAGDLETLNETVFEEWNSSNTLLANLTAKISAIQVELNTVESQMKTAKDNTASSREKLIGLQSRLDSINTEVNSVKENLESLSRDVNSIEITSSDQIVNPINTKIETISSDTNQLVSLLPYLLMLIIMFVGLMLASSLVVIEKSSRAFFRVFTTPTKDEFFIVTTFITAFIIVAVQMTVILFAISYFLIDVFTANLGLNILILVLAISIFIMVGMAIGYFIKSQQGANMTSISIGALFLMLSNFVLPIESIIPQLRFIAEYNPYVLASETLRRATIFSMPFKELIFEISVLLGFTVAIFIIIIFFQKLAKARYFNSNHHAKAKKIEEKKGLWIKNILVNDEKEFIEELQKFKNEEFKKFISRNSIKIKKFIRVELNKPELAKNIKKLSKKEFLDLIVKEKQDVLDEIKKKHEERVKKSKSHNDEKQAKQE